MTNVGKDMKKLEPLHIVSGKVNGGFAVDNSMVFLKKIQHRIIIWSRNSTFRYISKRTESKDSNRYLNIAIHNSIIYNRQKVETNQMLISG